MPWRLRTLARRFQSSDREALNRFVEPRQLERLRQAPAMTRGNAVVNGKATRYSDNAGLVQSVQEIFLDEVCRFHSANERPSSSMPAPISG